MKLLIDTHVFLWAAVALFGFAVGGCRPDAPTGLDVRCDTDEECAEGLACVLHDGPGAVCPPLFATCSLRCGTNHDCPAGADCDVSIGYCEYGLCNY